MAALRRGAGQDWGAADQLRLDEDGWAEYAGQLEREDWETDLLSLCNSVRLLVLARRDTITKEHIRYHVLKPIQCEVLHHFLTCRHRAGCKVEKTGYQLCCSCGPAPSTWTVCGYAVD